MASELDARLGEHACDALGRATLWPALTDFWWVSWWGPTHDEIGLVSRTNAIRAAATGRRAVAAAGVVADIDVAT